MTDPAEREWRKYRQATWRRRGKLLYPIYIVVMIGFFEAVLILSQLFGKPPS